MDSQLSPLQRTAVEMLSVILIQAGVRTAVRKLKDMTYNARRGKLKRADLKDIKPANSSWAAVYKNRSDR